MARWVGYNASSKQLGASSTVTFQPADMPFPVNGRGIAKLHVCIADTSGVVTRSTGIAGNISRVRVRAGGSTIFDTAIYPLTELVSQLGPDQVGYGNASTAQSLIGGFYAQKNSLSFTIPFDIIDAKTEDERDLCQFPLNKNPSVELTTNGSMTSSSYATLAWTMTDRVNPVWSPVFLGQAMNVPSGATSYRVPITEPGLIRAVGLSTQSEDIASTVWTAANGFKRYKVVLSGVEKAHGTPLTLLETQREHLDSAMDVGSATTSVPAICFLKNVGMLPGAPGSSYLEVDSGTYASGTYTNANFAAPATGAEYYLWSLQGQ